MEKAAKSKNLETWLKNEKNDLEFKKWKKKSGMKKNENQNEKKWKNDCFERRQSVALRFS